MTASPYKGSSQAYHRGCCHALSKLPDFQYGAGRPVPCQIAAFSAVIAISFLLIQTPAAHRPAVSAAPDGGRDAMTFGVMDCLMGQRGRVRLRGEDTISIAPFAQRGRGSYDSLFIHHP